MGNIFSYQNDDEEKIYGHLFSTMYFYLKNIKLTLDTYKNTGELLSEEEGNNYTIDIEKELNTKENRVRINLCMAMAIENGISELDLENKIFDFYNNYNLFFQNVATNKNIKDKDRKLAVNEMLNNVSGLIKQLEEILLVIYFPFQI